MTSSTVASVAVKRVPQVAQNAAVAPDPAPHRPHRRAVLTGTTTGDDPTGTDDDGARRQSAIRHRRPTGVKRPGYDTPITPGTSWR